MSTVEADPPRYALVARVSGLNAPRIAGNSGSEFGSGARSEGSMMIYNDPAGSGWFGDPSRSGARAVCPPWAGDPAGESWPGDADPADRRSGDLIGMSDDPAGSR